jgi:hypothetical protein
LQWQEQKIAKKIPKQKEHSVALINVADLQRWAAMKAGGGQKCNNKPSTGMAKAGGGWQQERLGAVWQQGNRQLHDGRQ